MKSKKKKISKILRFKSIVYKYTGIYLANEEELDYIQSEEFWKDWSKIMKYPKNDMRARDVQGLLIGMWQAHHGFARSMSFLSMKRPKWFWKPIAWFEELFKIIKWDLKALYFKIKPPKKKKAPRKSGSLLK